MNVKAYKAWDNRSVEPCSTVVFAKNVLEAKRIAIRSETCEDADYINIRVQRFPQMDKYFRGEPEVDWYDMEAREALVALGWMCLETSEECDACQARAFCGRWEGENEDNEAD